MSNIISKDELESLSQMTSGVIETIEKALEEGATESEAALAAGISPKSKLFHRIKKQHDILQRFASAKVRAKTNLIQSVNRLATKGCTVTEIRNHRQVVEKEDGSKVLELTGSMEIIKEIPPDAKAAIQLLKITYPEEFGDIRRVDLKKLGSAQQVDLESIPSVVEEPKKIIEMFLNGDGSYIPTSDDEDDEEDDEFLKTFAGDEKVEDDKFEEFD